MYIYRCEDSQEGIFTAIYNIYENHHTMEQVLVSTTDEPYLFAQDIPVENDKIKAGKVANTIKKRFGEEDCYHIAYALSGNHPDKAQALFKTIFLGISGNVRPGHLLDNLADENVNLIFTMSRAASKEFAHLRGFLRFEELEHGALYASYVSKNNVLPFLMEHFTDRFPVENFVIYDESRKSMGIHKTGENQWFLMKCDDEMSADLCRNNVKKSNEETEYQALFKWFCQRIAIKERRNLDLQRNMLPIRFRGHMTEFT